MRCGTWRVTGKPEVMHRNQSHRGPEVLLKGMSSEKHFSLPDRQKYFPASTPPATLLTPRLSLLDRLAMSRSGPVSRGAKLQIHWRLLSKKGTTFNPSGQVRFPSEMCERVRIEAGCPCSWDM